MRYRVNELFRRSRPGAGFRRGVAHRRPAITCHQERGTILSRPEYLQRLLGWLARVDVAFSVQADVPEPSNMWIIVAGIAGIVWGRKRWRNVAGDFPKIYISSQAG